MIVCVHMHAPLCAVAKVRGIMLRRHAAQALTCGLAAGPMPSRLSTSWQRWSLAASSEHPAGSSCTCTQVMAEAEMDGHANMPTARHACLQAGKEGNHGCSSGGRRGSMDAANTAGPLQVHLMPHPHLHLLGSMCAHMRTRTHMHARTHARTYTHIYTLIHSQPPLHYFPTNPLPSTAAAGPHSPPPPHHCPAAPPEQPCQGLAHELGLPTTCTRHAAPLLPPLTTTTASLPSSPARARPKRLGASPSSRVTPTPGPRPPSMPATSSSSRTCCRVIYCKGPSALLRCPPVDGCMERGRGLRPGRAA